MAAEPSSLPDLNMLALFGLGSFLMRGSGCIINDMWDRDFDRKVRPEKPHGFQFPSNIMTIFNFRCCGVFFQVERTKERPLASGEVSLVPAFVLLAGQLGLSSLILLQFNWLRCW